MGLEEMVLRRLGIRLRLAVAFGVFTLLLAAMAGVGAWRLAELHAIARDMSGVNVRMAQLVGQWLAETQTNVVRSVVLTHSDDAQLQRMLAPAFNGTAKRIDELAQEVEPLLATPQARKLFETIAAARKNYVDTRKAVVARKAAGDRAAVDTMMERELLPAGEAYIATLDALRAHYAADVEQDARDANDSATWGQRVLVAFCACGLLLAVLGAWLITRSITRPLDRAVATVGRVADGDLTVRVQEAGNDEVGRLLAGIATMTANLRALVGQVASSAHTVAETSAQIAQGNGDLSQRTEEQASTLEETASSMEELTSAVGQNAQTASEASQLAGNARALAQDGGQAVAEVVGTMNAIAASSGRISEITSVIDGIAFQTNILALNAAVEAARAGTQGRGFAVVAAEVRTLAQRSGEAAREIRGLITEAGRQVATGTQQADAAGRKMQEIVAAVVQVSDRFTELASSSEEQSSGIEQINSAITQMEQVVQQNATLVEEGAAATQALSGNASELLALVQRFKVEGATQRAPGGNGSLPAWSRSGRPAGVLARLNPAAPARVPALAGRGGVRDPTNL